MIQKGNPNSHIILRGGMNGTNFESKFVKETTQKNKDKNINTKIVIDCSHGNVLNHIDSNNCYKKQILVVDNIIEQIKNGETNIGGIMIESFINSGKQKFNFNNNFKYGVSITDSCIGFNETKNIIEKLYNSL